MGLEQADKDVLHDPTDKFRRISSSTTNLKGLFNSLSVENRMNTAEELKHRGDCVGKIMRIMENISEGYGMIESSGLRSRAQRSLVRGEQRILTGGEPLPFDIIPSEPRTGGTCSVLKVKMGNELYAMKHLNANISLEAFRWEERLLKDIRNPHITEVWGSIVDAANRLNIILTPWSFVSAIWKINNNKIGISGNVHKGFVLP